MENESSRTSPGIMKWLFAAWAAAAVALAASGVISVDMPRPLVACLIWIPALGFVSVWFVSAAVRQWVTQLDPRWAILYHVVRAGFGTLFLVLYARGSLPGAFALAAGPGDIVAGAGALLAAACVPIASRARHRIVFVWNVLALADILLVFVAAQRIVLFGDGPRALAALLSFPLSLVPVLVVPLILISHFIVFVQLHAASRRLGAASGPGLQPGTTLG